MSDIWQSAASSIRRAAALSTMTTPPGSTPSATLWGVQLRRQRCSSGFCPPTAERWTHLRHRSCRLACWFSARVKNRRRRLIDVSVGHKRLLLAGRLLNLWFKKCDVSPPLPNLPLSYPHISLVLPRASSSPLLLVWRSDFDFCRRTWS